MRIDNVVLPTDIGIYDFLIGRLTGDFIGVIAFALALLALLVSRDDALRPMRPRNLLLSSVFVVAHSAVMRAPADTAVYDNVRILVLGPAFVAAVTLGGAVPQWC